MSDKNKFDRIHLDILLKMATTWFLRETPDGYFLRKFIGHSKKMKKAMYLERKIAPKTVRKMIRLDLIAYRDPADEDDPILESFYTKIQVEGLIEEFEEREAKRRKRKNARK